MQLHTRIAARTIIYTTLIIFLSTCLAPQKRAPIAAPDASLIIAVASLDPSQERPVGAQIILNNRTYTTGERSWVLIEGLQSGAYDLQVTHPDYAPAFPRIYVNAEHNRAHVKLKPVAQHTVADVRRPAVIESNGTRINVPAHAFAEQPRGPVRAEFAALDVTGPDIAAMPGEFTGRLAKGAEVMIESLGAVSLSFYDESGKELQIAKGRTIDVRLPCNGDVKDETIPLWSFDEERAAWIEEGAATVVHDADGCHFEMKLPHLSWWNVDRPIEERTSIRIADVVLPNGERVAEPLITATGTDYNGYSSALGRRGKSGVMKGSGFCIDVKPHSRVKLTVEYFQSQENGTTAADTRVPWHRYETVIRSGEGGTSCREHATGGLELGRLTLASMGETEFTTRLRDIYGKFERLRLRGGTDVRGAILEQNGTTLLVDTGDRIQRLETRQVEYITYPGPRS